MASVTFFEEFLTDVANNDTESITRKIKIAKNLDEGFLTGKEPHWLRENPSIEIFKKIIDSIHPFDDNFVSRIMIKCSHEGQLDMLQVLLDHYPQIPFDICEMIKPSMHIESIPAVLDILATRPKKVM